MNYENSPTEEKTELDPSYDISKKDQIPEWIVNEAFLINDALNKGTVSKDQAEAGRGEEGSIFKEDEILEVMKGLASPKMFVELPWENLEGENRGVAMQKLFRQKMVNEKGEEVELGDYLAEKGMSLSIAMSKLDDETAEAIRYLNEKNVPAIAWVVVEDTEGYWTNRANVPQTILKTREILDWAKEKNIKLHAVGFDSEKPVQLIAAAANMNIVGMAREIIDYKRKQKIQRELTGENPQQQFDKFIRELTKEGVETEIYTFPNPLKPILGGIGIAAVDRSIEMLYLKPWLVRLLRDKKAIPAFGIVARPELPNSPAERPGRDFRVVEEISKGKESKEIERSPVGKTEHLTQDELDELIEIWLDQEINIKNREFKVRDVYGFAMNDRRVATMLARAMERGFEKQADKIK